MSTRKKSVEERAYGAQGAFDVIPGIAGDIGGLCGVIDHGIDDEDHCKDQKRSSYLRHCGLLNDVRIRAKSFPT
jgi:hypothetical protein